MADDEQVIRTSGVDWQLPLVVVSPHLDDAVLSAGNLLEKASESTVVTVLAGNPGVWTRATLWDRRCGFNDGDDVVAARIAENVAALSRLGAVGIELDYLDSQYGACPSAEIVGATIADQIRRVCARSVVGPIGIGHGDHCLVAAACGYARGKLPDLDWYAYGDLPYSYEATAGPMEIRRVRERLTGQGVMTTQYLGSTASPSKKQAIGLYASQNKGLGETRVRLAFKQEQYWKLSSAKTP